MGDFYTAKRTVRENFEKKIQERKKSILYLIRSYLQDCSMEKTVETLIKEANLLPEIEVCDNIDLDTILQEYTSFYFAKFNKYPKICKKTDANNNTAAQKKILTKRSTLSLSPTESKIPQKLRPKPSSQSEEDFEITIKQISNVNVPEKDSQITNCLEEFLPGPENKELMEHIKKEIINKNLGVTWQDCIGLEKVIQLLKEAVIYPKKYPSLFANVSTWKGVILYGPPGTGKTLVAKALASEAECTFINLSPSTFISKWRGESEKLIKTLFDMAKQYAPTTIFIDELDALASKRDEAQHEASRRFKSELLTQMDGVLHNNDNIFVLATTNLPWNIDQAILRRFDKKLFVDLPTYEARERLFKKYLNFPKNEGSLYAIYNYTKQTENFSCSDIKLVCKNAYMSVIRRELTTIGDKDMEDRACEPTVKDVEQAIQNTRPGQVSREKYLEWEKNFGCS